MHVIVLLAGTSAIAQTQNVGIGTDTPNASALLELNSTSKGLLITRLTNAERNSITLPAHGLIIYNTDTREFEYNYGTEFAPVWRRLIGLDFGGGFWSITGNAGTNPAVHFLGTTDQQSLTIRTNSQIRLTVDAVGVVSSEGLIRIQRGGLDLAGTQSPLLMAGTPGVAGQVLVSGGAGTTPQWTGNLQLNDLSVNNLASFAGPTSITGPTFATSLNTISTFSGPVTLKADFKVESNSQFTLLPILPLKPEHLLIGSAAGVAVEFVPGVNGEMLLVEGGRLTWKGMSAEVSQRAWMLGGNPMPSSTLLGNLSGDLDLVAGNITPRLTVSSTTGRLITRQGIEFLVGAELILSGTPGGAGNVLISRGPSSSPQWSGAMNVDVSTGIVNIGGNTFGPTSTTLVNPVTVTSSATFQGPVTFNGSVTFSNLPDLPLNRGHILVGNTANIAASFAPGANNEVLVSQGGTPVWSSSLSNLTLNNSTLIDAAATNLSVSGTLHVTANSTFDGPVTFNNTVSFSTLPNLPLTHNHLFVGNASNLASPFSPGSEGSILGIIGGQPAWFDLAGYIDDRAWVIGGNPAPASTIIGNTATTGLVDLNIRAGNETLIHLDGTAKRVNLRSGVNLDGGTVELRLNGDAGINGSVLISQGIGTTPKYSTALSVTDAQITINAPTTFQNTVTFTQLPELPLQRGHILVGNAANRAESYAPGFHGSILTIDGNTPKWTVPGELPFWSLTGNAGIATTEYLGTTDASDFRLATNGAVRVTVAAGTGSVTMTSLAGTPAGTTSGTDNGVVVAGATGTLTKVDRTSLLAMLGIFAGRYENTGAAPVYTVVITMPVGAQLTPGAAITLTPEAPTSVSITPFIVAGSRTANSFTVSFPGGLYPGEAINWTVHTP